MKKTENRRDFMRTCGRAGAFTALAGVCGILAARRDPNCINLGRCHGCDLFRSCTLPEAETTRSKAPSS